MTCSRMAMDSSSPRALELFAVAGDVRGSPQFQGGAGPCECRRRGWLASRPRRRACRYRRGWGRPARRCGRAKARRAPTRLRPGGAAPGRAPGRCRVRPGPDRCGRPSISACQLPSRAAKTFFSLALFIASLATGLSSRFYEDTALLPDTGERERLRIDPA